MNLSRYKYQFLNIFEHNISNHKRYNDAECDNYGAICIQSPHGRKLTKQFDSLCSNFTMTASMGINVFARAVVRERRIPFEISAPEQEISREKAMKNILQDMNLDEINE